MTAAPGRSGRFVLAPVVDGVAAWDRGAELLLSPVRLSSPVSVALAFRQRYVTSSR
jgi:hypothetical protein